MRVGLTYNLKNLSQDPAEVEWDDPATIKAILQAISQKHDVVPILADSEAYSKLRDSSLDIVFNIAEGKGGRNRESHLPAILEYLQIPYTGSDPFTLSACLDKSRTKEILNFYSIANPRFQVVRKVKDLRWNYFPAVVKPLWEGSSMGVHNNSWVQNQHELEAQAHHLLKAYDQPALIEEALTGREFTAALLGNGDDLKVLPIVEVKMDALPSGSNPLYSYEAKWIWDTPQKPLEIFECPANIHESLKEKIEKLAKHAFRALECRDWCRIDIRLDSEGCPHVLELNPLPGILPNPDQNSCFPKAARAAGMNFSKLILSVLNIAIKRYGLYEIQEIPKAMKQAM